MCGIVGYTGSKNASDIILEGLTRLEYRGYDSAGIATISDGSLNVIKEKGPISVLKEKVGKEHLISHRGIGHTRWATHGAPSRGNAHPHSYNRVTIVHNGIIENHSHIKNKLIAKGHVFKSKTDSEVIAHLLDEFLDDNHKPLDAIPKLCEALSGAYALAIMIDGDEKIYFAKANSPLLIAKGNNGCFIASDQAAMVGHAERFYPLGDKEIGYVTKDKINVFNLKLEHQDVAFKKLMAKSEDIQKNGHKHFMHKEIFEQPSTIERLLYGRIRNNRIDLSGFLIDFNELKNINRVHLIGCGSAYLSAVLAKTSLQKHLNLPVSVDVASEFRYFPPLLDEKTLVIAISQSGETADTVAAFKLALDNGAKCLSICNVVGSVLTTLAEKSVGTAYLNAGPEISVASTKAFVAQACMLKLLAFAFAKAKGTISQKEEMSIVRQFYLLCDDIKEVINKDLEIRNLAKRLINEPRMLYLGRGEYYAIALEGALKMKELSYIFAEGYPAGELKHGPIATIDRGMPAVVIAGHGLMESKTLSNLYEVKARGAKIISIAPKDSSLLKDQSDYFIGLNHSSPYLFSVLSTVALQLLAYHLSDLKGFNVDKPRNLAKSVTVE